MPSYSPPSPSQDQLPERSASQATAISADPLAQQASTYGNAFMVSQAVQPDPPEAATTRAGERWASDPTLLPFYELLNDPTIAPADRAEAMLRYRNQKLAKAEWSPMAAILAGKDDMPLSMEPGREGTHYPLFERLGQDPAMQQLVLDLSQRALAMPAEAVDINALWEGTREGAAALDPEHADQASLRALQAMATFMNAQKLDRAAKFPIDPGTGVPATMPDGVSPGLWQAMSAANRHVAEASTPDAAVMSHGVDARKAGENIPYTADNNYHFWTHAWVSASLQAEHGLSPEAAEAISAVAGAQYELKPGSFREEHGNAGMKDILMNAEGAAFGSDLVRDPSAALPGQDQGPPYDVRALGHMDAPDPATDAVLQRADVTTLEGLLEAVMDGVLANDSDGPKPSTAGLRMPRPLY